MTKSQFLSALKSELAAREYDEGYYSSYMARLEHFFSTIADEDFEKRFINNDKEIEKIADYIGNMLKKEQEKSYDNNIREDAFSAPAEEAEPEEEKISIADACTVQFDAVKFSDAVKSNDFVLNIFDEDSKTREGDIIPLSQEANIEEIAEQTFKPSPLSKKQIKFEELDRESTPASPIFWLLFILTLPITVPIAITIGVLFVGVVIGLALLIAAVFIALVALVAVGSISGLAEIIFGIIQTFSFEFGGMFEIGIGIIMVGATMLLGILLYNLAIRLLPLLIKYWSRLFMYMIRKFRKRVV